MKQVIIFLTIAVIAITAQAQTTKPDYMFTAKPFKIDVPQAVLDDLHARLRQTRWPDAPANIGWKYGTDPVFLKDLVAYWQNGYDWRKQEAALNQFPSSAWRSKEDDPLPPH